MPPLKAGRAPQRFSAAIRALAAGIALASPVASGSADAAPNKPPNIVWITLDTMRADRLGCYGYFRETPGLDAFAREALLFENAFSHMGTTLPAHISLMTSTYPRQHGVRNNTIPFGDRQREAAGLRTLPEALRDAGYATAGFVSATPLKAESGIADGFDTYHQPDGKQHEAAKATAEALRWLETAPEEPFFLWVHYFDPHDPYRAPVPFDALFKPDGQFLDYLRGRGFTGWDRTVVHERNNQYDGEVLYMDAHIDLLLKTLRERDLYDNAAILVVGDHGESLGQHNWRGHGRLHGEILRVPMLLKLPGMGTRDAKRHSGVIGLIDVVPTLADELKLPLDAAYRAQLRGENVLRRGPRGFVMSERVIGRPDKVGPGEQHALTTDRWSYYLTTEGAERIGEQLYDRRADPHEQRNLIDAEPKTAARLRRQLTELLDTVQPLADDPAEEALTEERREELRALGYID